ncbi:hypothetical protein [Candidatus Manganitrophus noduliformans]|uniref:Uncharacterized protein n=1 Tax=Candidatus Manganitrophus noduliformans TaxID=2606439 RepID=A0A7X6DNF5_9BACT|nr:hypothetical protein [Candidatus Manganitrophus noduliformans]NKE70437.1 hypothetical protein [Candidatus Manganitrophus noduliformans]
MLENGIPENHPLRLHFLILTEKSFQQTLNWSDPLVTDYISNLLLYFTRTDCLYAIRNSRGNRIDTVAEMLMEGDILLRARTIEREWEVHRHIGDYTLFMSGLFPEYLKRLKSGKKIEHPDFLIDYVRVGKKSYRRAAEFNYGRFKEWTPLYRKLAEHFEICIAGLGLIREELDRSREWQSKKQILS